MNLTDNYFSVFGLPVKYEIDESNLTLRYRDLQKQLHPDKYASSTGSERAVSLQKAAMINDAYNVLKNPLRRARYILELNGFVLNDDANTVMDPEFLMQQMELRDSLEAVSSAADPIGMLDGLADDIEAQTSTLKKELSELFVQSANDYNRIASTIRKLQFYARLQEDVDSMYERFE